MYYVSLKFTLSRFSTYALNNGVVQATSTPLWNGCSLIYAESGTISCYHPPLRIQPCTNVGQGPHNRNTFTVQSYLTVHCRISAITAPLLNVIRILQSIEINWKRWKKNVKSYPMINFWFILYLELLIKLRTLLLLCDCWTWMPNGEPR